MAAFLLAQTLSAYSYGVVAVSHRASRHQVVATILHRSQIAVSTFSWHELAAIFLNESNAIGPEVESPAKIFAAKHHAVERS